MINTTIIEAIFNECVRYYEANYQDNSQYEIKTGDERFILSRQDVVDFEKMIALTKMLDHTILSDRLNIALEEYAKYLELMNIARKELILKNKY